MNPDFRIDSCRPDSDRPLVGWICSYTPEELIVAAGFVPYRIDPTGAGTGSDAYLPANLCPYVRSLLDAGKTEIRGLRGVVFVNSCDAMRRLADIWSARSGARILYRLDCPRRTDEAAENYLVARYRELLAALEQESGQTVQADAIRRAVEVLNETRRLIGRLAALRGVRKVAMSGGVARNSGVVKAIERAINARLELPADPQITGALGAALIAGDAADAGEARESQR